jgi:CheY-like chemotaxis protein
MSATRVLIVDDNPFNVKLASYVLTAEGFDVRSLGAPEEVEAMIATWAPGIVLMDLNLPGMDGLTLTRVLRENPAYERLPIVAFSAENTRGDEQRAIAAGCNGYITKPIRIGSFGSEVRRYLASAQASPEPS